MALFYVGNGLLIASQQLSRIPCTVSLALSLLYNGCYLSNSSRPELVRACRVAPMLSSLSSHGFGVKSGTTTPSLFSLSIHNRCRILWDVFVGKCLSREGAAQARRREVACTCSGSIQRVHFHKINTKSVNYWTIGTYLMPVSNWIKNRPVVWHFRQLATWHLIPNSRS